MWQDKLMEILARSNRGECVGDDEFEEVHGELIEDLLSPLTPEMKDMVTQIVEIMKELRDKAVEECESVSPNNDMFLEGLKAAP